MGNILTPLSGPTKINIVDAVITLDGDGDNNILNRAIVIHANADDLGLGGDGGSLLTGNAGARLACGIIQEIQPCKLHFRREEIRKIVVK